MVLALPLEVAGCFTTRIKQFRARLQYPTRVSCRGQHGDTKGWPQSLLHAFAKEYGAGDSIGINIQMHMPQLAGCCRYLWYGIECLLPCPDGLQGNGQHHWPVLAHGLGEQGVVKRVLFVLFGEQDVQPHSSSAMAAYLVQ